MGLEKSMIIQKKAKELPLRLILKSVFLTLLTWLLWMYSLYAIYTYAQKIFAIPVLEQFFFHQIVALLFIGSAVLLIMTVIWSFIARSYKR